MPGIAFRGKPLPDEPSRKPMHLWEFANVGELTEKKIERMCISIYRSVGVWVVEFSQPHTAKGQTPGIPDLLCYFQRDSRVERWWHEVKAKKGKLSAHQERFHLKLQEYGNHVVVGGLNTAIRALHTHGVARFNKMPEHW